MAHWNGEFNRLLPCWSFIRGLYCRDLCTQAHLARPQSIVYLTNWLRKKTSPLELWPCQNATSCRPQGCTLWTIVHGQPISCLAGSRTLSLVLPCLPFYDLPHAWQTFHPRKANLVCLGRNEHEWRRLVTGLACRLLLPYFLDERHIRGSSFRVVRLWIICALTFKSTNTSSLK